MTDRHIMKHIREWHGRWGRSGLTANFYALALGVSAERIVKILNEKLRWGFHRCSSVEHIVWDGPRTRHERDFGNEGEWGEPLTRKSALRLAYDDAKEFGRASIYQHEVQDHMPSNIDIPPRPIPPDAKIARYNEFHQLSPIWEKYYDAINKWEEEYWEIANGDEENPFVACSIKYIPGREARSDADCVHCRRPKRKSRRSGSRASAKRTRAAGGKV